MNKPLMILLAVPGIVILLFSAGFILAVACSRVGAIALRPVVAVGFFPMLFVLLVWHAPISMHHAGFALRYQAGLYLLITAVPLVLLEYSNSVRATRTDLTRVK